MGNRRELLAAACSGKPELCNRLLMSNDLANRMNRIFTAIVGRTLWLAVGLGDQAVSIWPVLLGVIGLTTLLRIALRSKYVF